MSARLSGAPWLLIEMCARSLVTDESAGCSTGAAIDRLKTNLGTERQRVADQAFIGLDIGKTHHWVCALDGAGKPLLSRKIANTRLRSSHSSPRPARWRNSWSGGRHDQRAVGADP